MMPMLLCAFLWLSPEDFTDSGVGCVEDCLEIQDEAETTLSMERN